MIVRMLDQQSLNAWVDALIARSRVVGVQAKGDRFAFDDLSAATDLRLDYDVTILPPKKYFLPQEEVLLRFKGEHYETVTEAEPFVLLGVHPYDAVAIAQMDVLFAEGQYDRHYMDRRNAATIVAVDIQNVSENCFAGCMGTAVAKDGMDVLLTKVGERYVVEAYTPKGEELMAHLADAPKADRGALLGRVRVWEKSRRDARKHELLPAPEDLPELLAQGYDDEVWEEKARLCFSCGSCNLVCPTCYCFDVQDEVDWDLQSGERSRTWDGCMLESFALVAGGHNFRSDKAARYRHRYYRKGKYIHEKIGEIACVGCGRCITACVAKIANPVEVYNALYLTEEAECPVPAQTMPTSTSRR